MRNRGLTVHVAALTLALAGAECAVAQTVTEVGEGLVQSMAKARAALILGEKDASWLYHHAEAYAMTALHEEGEWQDSPACQRLARDARSWERTFLKDPPVDLPLETAMDSVVAVLHSGEIAASLGQVERARMDYETLRHVARRMPGVFDDDVRAHAVADWLSHFSREALTALRLGQELPVFHLKLEAPRLLVEAWTERRQHGVRPFSRPKRKMSIQSRTLASQAGALTLMTVRHTAMRPPAARKIPQALTSSVRTPGAYIIIGPRRGQLRLDPAGRVEAALALDIAAIVEQWHAGRHERTRAGTEDHTGAVITMGMQETEPEAGSAIARLNADIAMLARWPERAEFRNLGYLEKVASSCAASDERQPLMAELARLGKTERPGSAGLLHYRVLQLLGRASDADAMLDTMTKAPERFFGVHTHAFPLLQRASLAAGVAGNADRAMRLIEAEIGLSDAAAPDIWQAAANRFRDAGARALATRLEDVIVERHPKSATAKKISAQRALAAVPAETRALDRMAETARNNPKHWPGYAKALSDAGRLDEADAVYRRYLARTPDIRVHTTYLDFILAREDTEAFLREAEVCVALYSGGLAGRHLSQYRQLRLARGEEREWLLFALKHRKYSASPDRRQQTIELLAGVVYDGRGEGEEWAEVRDALAACPDRAVLEREMAARTRKELAGLRSDGLQREVQVAVADRDLTARFPGLSGVRSKATERIRWAMKVRIGQLPRRGLKTHSIQGHSPLQRTLQHVKRRVRELRAEP